MMPILHLGPFRFYTFGLLFGAAVCLGTFTFLRYFRRHGIGVNPPVLACTLISAGFIGAKLDNAIVVGMHMLHGHPFTGSLSEFLTSGYTYLGCVVAGLLAGAIYVHLKRLPWLRTFDSLYCIAPAYALGRLGCFLAGDGDYGTASSLPWAVAFPHGLIPTTTRVHPTMLYNAAWELLVFAVLARAHRRHPRPGTLFGAYLVATAVGRFFIEFLSRNPVLALDLTEAQFVSIGLFLAGGNVLIFARQHTTAQSVRCHPDQTPATETQRLIRLT